ncbi:hypothetical protein L1085_035220 [Streptomyces sp. MSC1_001]|uniref:hypothetical protein n=1 Tax=Streptomyces sp. MSC1_001 TaxID=2909263 RepID=UPI002030D030|nr:hypothetical protein [Streptomyces sp. MSC1_001]
MGAVEMSRAEAVALVQRVMDADYASEDEADAWLGRLDRALACPSGHVSGLIFWPPAQSERRPASGGAPCGWCRRRTSGRCRSGRFSPRRRCAHAGAGWPVP